MYSLRSTENKEFEGSPPHESTHIHFRRARAPPSRWRTTLGFDNESAQSLRHDEARHIGGSPVASASTGTFSLTMYSLTNSTVQYGKPTLFQRRSPFPSYDLNGFLSHHASTVSPSSR
jgi:hypothetical protein